MDPLFSVSNQIDKKVKKGEGPVDLTRKRTGGKKIQ
jgi:hypothetical protein